MKHLYIYLLTLCIIMATACTNNIEETLNLNDNITVNVQNRIVNSEKRFEQIEKMTAAVNHALCSSRDFRMLLKEEASKQFDGDCDIMLRPLSTKKLTDVSSARATKGTATVGDILNDFLTDYGKSSSDDIIGTLCSAYPLLQISIPVHLEEWDPETYIPAVVCDAKDFGATSSDFVYGYNSDKEKVKFSVLEEPSVPVVVIGLNERGGEKCLSSIRVKQDTEVISNLPPQDGDIALSSSITLQGVLLSWLTTQGDVPMVIYYVYRKAVGIEDSFTRIATVYSDVLILNNCYTDTQLSSNTTYEYYIHGTNIAIETILSNTISVTTSSIQPTALTSFSAQTQNNAEVFVNWLRPQNAASLVTLFRQNITDAGSTNEKIATISNTSISSYTDNPTSQGKKYRYTAYNCINGIYSAPYYDITYLPFRNISIPAPIYIKFIGTNLDDRYHLEFWTDGSPEFKIKCSAVAGDTGTITSIGTITMAIHGTSFTYHSFDYFNSANLMCNWLPSTPYDKLLISVREVDDGLENLVRTFAFNAARKIGLSAGIDSLGSFDISDTLGVNQTITYSTNDVQICDQIISYFENPTFSITGAYGFTMNMNATNE